MFLAGYVGGDDAWTSLSAAWPSAIAPHKALHLKKLRFGEDRHKALLERAGAVPSSCGLIPIMAGVRMNDYADLIQGGRDAKLLSGWVLCCFAMLMNSLRAIPGDERLEIVFEQQAEYEPFANIACSTVCGLTTDPSLQFADGTSRLANWRFVPKGETILTQPADYLAFALFQMFRDETHVKSLMTRPIIPSRSAGAMLHRTQVRKLISDSVVSSLLRQTKEAMENSRAI